VRLSSTMTTDDLKTGIRPIPEILCTSSILEPMGNVQHILFFLVLFDDAFSCQTYIASNDRIVNDELERMWKEEIVAKFKVLSHCVFIRHGQFCLM
jgi:hypothetical protein